jgi:hypothetical protein
MARVKKIDLHKFKEEVEPADFAPGSGFRVRLGFTEDSPDSAA